MSKTSLSLFLLTCAVSVVAAVPAHADPKADALLKDVVSKYNTFKTFSATVTSYLDTGSSKMRGTETLQLQKPNLAHIVPMITTEIGENGVVHAVLDSIRISNGKTLWTFDKAANTYQTASVDPAGGLIVLNSNAIGLFYMPELLFSNDFGGLFQATTSSRYIGVEKLNGMACQVVESTFKVFAKPGAQPNRRTLRLYIGPDKLVHRIVQDSVLVPGGTLHMEETLTNLRINPNVPAADFNFTPPSGAQDTTQK